MPTTAAARLAIADGAPARFEIRVGDNHLACRSCDTVLDIDCGPGAAPCLETQVPPGFVVDEAEVTWWGYCADCTPRRDELILDARPADLNPAFS